MYGKLKCNKPRNRDIKLETESVSEVYRDA